MGPGKPGTGPSAATPTSSSTTPQPLSGMCPVYYENIGCDILLGMLNGVGMEKNTCSQNGSQQSGLHRS